MRAAAESVEKIDRRDRTRGGGGGGAKRPLLWHFARFFRGAQRYARAEVFFRKVDTQLNFTKLRSTHNRGGPIPIPEESQF